MHKKYVRNWNNLVVNQLNLQTDYLWVQKIYKIMGTSVIINLLVNIRWYLKVQFIEFLFFLILFMLIFKVYFITITNSINLIWGLIWDLIKHYSLNLTKIFNIDQYF
jgi:hypothetical protein